MGRLSRKQRKKTKKIPNLRWGPEYFWGFSCPSLLQCLQSELTPLTHVKCQSCVSKWFLCLWKPDSAEGFLMSLCPYNKYHYHLKQHQANIKSIKKENQQKRGKNSKKWYLLHGNFTVDLFFVRDIQGSLNSCVWTFWVYCASLFCHVNQCKNYSRLHD